MTWTAPQVERPDFGTVGDERTLLEAFLDYHRQTLLRKCSGLTAEQLKMASTPPSNLTLLGLIRHMTDVEHGWFTNRTPEASLPFRYWSPEGDSDFDGVADADAEADLATYLDECQAARDAAAKLSLEHTFVSPRSKKEFNLRWVYIHMIEEYARHNGHADLIREAIDGATGE
ncbi:MAG TPA: DinB family protein [Micromonosporaceae bacterium]